METMDAIASRRSTRRFSSEKVDHKAIGQLLEACKWAPSAGNRQPWDIIIVDDKKKKQALAKLSHDQDWLAKAPVILVICINKKITGETFGQRGEEIYGLQSTAAAAQNMMLAATDMGLGSCWADAYNEKGVKTLLECPEHIRPLILLAVGYPKEESKHLSEYEADRYEITNFSYYNKYREHYKQEWKGLANYAQDFKERLFKSLEKY